MSSYALYVKKVSIGEKNIIRRFFNWLKRPKRIEVTWNRESEEELKREFSVSLEDEIAKAVGREVVKFLSNQEEK